MGNTKETEMQNLMIQGREFTVTTTEHQSMPYMLTGARGAVYGAFRFANDPSRMWVANYRAGALRIAGNAVYLSDATGELRVA